MRRQTTPKIKVPMEFGGWTLYESSGNRGNLTLIYGHKQEDCWCVVRPTSMGPELIVFADEISEQAATELDRLLEFALRGTEGVPRDISAYVRDGGAPEAYDEAAMV